MKRWQIVYGLPLEVWVDIFSYPWITREEFGRIVDKIGNFKFAEHAQFFLHEWGKRKLLMYTVYFQQDGLFKFIEDQYFPRFYLDVPQTPLPANIKSFDSIQINHFDAKTMAFLDQIRPLLTGVEIEVAHNSDELDNLGIIFTTMAPLLDSIHSLHCNQHTLFVAQQCLGEQFNQAKQLTYLHMNGDAALVQANVNTIVDWLTQPDGPRLFDLNVCSGNWRFFFEQIIRAVRQQFLAANAPSTFALILRSYRTPEIHLENGIGEQLHGVCAGNGRFRIIRRPAASNTHQVWAWIWANIAEKHCGRIGIYEPTIGSLDVAAQIGVPPADGEQQAEQQQQPSCSKDA